MARNLGTYAIREFLISSWPTADVGDYAVVEKTATVYRYTPEGWIDSGSPADSIGKDYTAESEGTGEGDVFKEQVGTAFKFRSIKAGTNVTVVESDGEITISSAGSEWEGWSGKVATFNLLPDATEHDNEVWLVLQSSGVPILNYHSDGLYVSTGTAWDFLGPVPDAYMDTVFRVYNNTDGSKQIAFDASHVGTGQTRTITMPDKNIDLTDAVFSDSPSSTVGNVLISDNVDGRHLSDSGIASSKLVQGDSDTATVGHVATISNVDGKHVSDSGIVSADLIISDIASTVDGDFLVCNSTTGRHAKVLGSAEVSLSQYITIDITSADGTVPSYKYRGVILTGSLPANRIVTLPTAIYGMDVINNCTGAYYVYIKTASGTGVYSAPGDVRDVYCDGINVLNLHCDAPRILVLALEADYTQASGTTGTKMQLVAANDALAEWSTANDRFIAKNSCTVTIDPYIRVDGTSMSGTYGYTVYVNGSLRYTKYTFAGASITSVRTNSGSTVLLNAGDYLEILSLVETGTSMSVKTSSSIKLIVE